MLEMDKIDDEDVETTLDRLQREWQEDTAEISCADKPSYSYGCARTSGVAVVSKPLLKKQKRPSKSVLKIKVVPCTQKQKRSNSRTASESKNGFKQQDSYHTKIKDNHVGKELIKSPQNSKEELRSSHCKRTGNVGRGSGSYPCEECGQVFSFKANLRRHEACHFASVNDFQCDQCDKTFSLKRNLARHMKLHKIDRSYRPFSCDECSKSFKQAKTLQQHKKIIHSNIRPYPCQFCIKTFKTFFNLQSHEAIHLNCRSYVCQFCGMAFIRSSYRTIHERIHTNERPFKCDVCDKSFTRGDHLKNHKKVHLQSNSKSKRSKRSK